MAILSALIAVAAQALQASIAAQPIHWIPADPSAWIEVGGFVTGIVAVYLVVKSNLWTWPIGIANVLLYGYFFFVVALHYANAALQVVFLVAQIHGWFAWCRRDASRAVPPVRTITPTAWLGLGIGIVLATAALVPLLQEAGGNVPFFDALTTAISLGAQLLLNLRRIENWLLWIAADTIYVPLYVYRQYYPTALLYGVFLVLAVMGYFAWKGEMTEVEPATPPMPY